MGKWIVENHEVIFVGSTRAEVVDRRTPVNDLTRIELPILGAQNLGELGQEMDRIGFAAFEVVQSSGEVEVVRFEPRKKNRRERRHPN